MENEVIENFDDELVVDVVESNEIDNRPTREFLLECFNYVPDTGEFIWNVRPLHHFLNSNTMNAWNTKYAGKKVNSDNRITISHNNTKVALTLEKIIWKIMYDKYPDNRVLHINNERDDFRLTNLKESVVAFKNNRTERWDNKSIDLGTKEYFDKYIRYEEESGKIFWKDRDVSKFKNDAYYRMWKTKYYDKEITKVDRDGYYRVALEGKEYKAHRVIWMMCYNEDPKDFFIDHINGIKNDNRIENLRKATPSENLRNQTKLSKANTTGHRGIYKGKTENTWIVRLKLGVKLTTLGTFCSLEEAIEVRRKAIDKHYGEFAGIV